MNKYSISTRKEKINKTKLESEMLIKTHYKFQEENKTQGVGLYPINFIRKGGVKSGVDLKNPIFQKQKVKVTKENIQANWEKKQENIYNLELIIYWPINRPENSTLPIVLYILFL